MVTIERGPPQPIEEDNPPSLPLPSQITNGVEDSQLPQPRHSNARDNFLIEARKEENGIEPARNIFQEEDQDHPMNRVGGPQLGLDMDMQVGKIVGTGIQPNQELPAQTRTQYVKLDLALDYIDNMQEDMRKMNIRHQNMIAAIEDNYKKIEEDSQRYFLECYRDQRAKMKKENNALKEELKVLNVQHDSTVQDFQESKKHWLNESVHHQQENLALNERLKSEMQSRELADNDQSLHVNNLMLAQTKMGDKLKKQSREKKRLKHEVAQNEADIVALVVNNMITQIELFEASGEEKIVVREVPVQIAAPTVPDIEESVASLEDEYIPRPPPPKSRLGQNSLRGESPFDQQMRMMPAPLLMSSEPVLPNPEKFEEESRAARMQEIEIIPLKERIILLSNKEEKGTITPQEKKELEGLVQEYQEKALKLKEQQIKAERYKPASVTKQELVALSANRRSLDAIGPDASQTEKLKNENDLLKSDITMLQKEKKALEGQVKQFRDQRSSWVDKQAAQQAVEEVKGEEGIPGGTAVVALQGQNSELRKKMRSIEAELDALRKKEADQEEEKQVLLMDRVDKEEYQRLENQNKKLLKDIDELRSQLSKRISDKKIHDQFVSLQEENNKLSTDMAEFRKNKQDMENELLTKAAAITALENQRDSLRIAVQRATPKAGERRISLKEDQPNLSAAAAAVVVGGDDEELRGDVKRLEGQLQKANHEVNSLKLDKEELEMKLQKMDSELILAKEELDVAMQGGQKSTKEMKAKLDKLREENDKRIMQLNTDLSASKAALNEATEKMEKMQKEKLTSIGGLQKKLTVITGEHEVLTQQNNANKKKIEELTEKNNKLMEELEATKKIAGKASQLQADLTEATAKAAELTRHAAQIEDKYKQEVLKRKKLHNELEDMRGKIRVYARVRPLNKNEKDMGSPNVVEMPDQFSIQVQSKLGLKSFNFDTCFGPASTQEEIFEDTKRLVQSAIDGFNVCVFAYGQTGSGKTYTIQGPHGNPGVAPRAIIELYDLISEMGHCQIKVETYMVELYLDQLNDLLHEQSAPPQKLEIKEDPNGMMYIQGVTRKPVRNVEEAERIFTHGLNSRKTASTKMNDESSRSHLIFSMLIDVRNNATGKRTVGKLSFIDLAGSERLNKTDATSKERVHESMAINSSLSALANVISKLASGNAKFIPYRDHKLTLLMKDSIGGNAKTLMFVNVSPAQYNANETVQSLGYAMRVKEIKNDVTKNTESLEVARYKQRNRELETLNDKLKRLLQENDIAFENVPEEDYDIEEIKIGE